MTRAALKVIAAEPEAADIYAGWRAEIAARDWSRVHISGDKSPALDFNPSKWRTWR